jgi:UDP-N-acetylglucosamine/UDP-N-acetylgalactosamine diphosphorylase
VTTGRFQLPTNTFLVPDEVIRRRFEDAGQGHVFRFAEKLDAPRRENLYRSARSVDLEFVERLADGSSLAKPSAAPEPLGPEVQRRAALLENRVLREQAEQEGRDLVRRCKVACLTVAGGQGTRLGFDGPKGCFPLGPGDRTLFDRHAEGVAAASRESARPIPWVIIVSEATEDATRSYIRRRGLPGVEPASVRLVRQGSFPALDDAGKLLLEDVDRIATAPDGHGGALRCLRTTGTLAWLLNLGIEELSYFQVDNPLVPPVDPVFLGLHRKAHAQMSVKVFPKADPAEKVGVVVRKDRKTGVVEYSELPKELAEKRDAHGNLVYWAANMAAHAVSLPFAAAVAFRGLPIHRVHKKVPFVDEQGRRVEPAEPNAWKFETFVFDAMPMAAHCVVMEVDRSREFAPVKNASGVDSPETARALLQAAGRW